VNVYEIIIYRYGFGCFRLPTYIIRIFLSTLLIIELYILSVALPMFGLCSVLGNTLQYRMLLYLLSVPNILGIQVCVTFVSVQCSTAYVLTVDFCHVCTLQN